MSGLLTAFSTAIVSICTLVSWNAQVSSGSLDTSGQIGVNGKPVPFLIRRLPVSSYPELPVGVAHELTSRGCLIPQTYEAKRPENVIHASLERKGSSDWAVLCSVRGQVSLLVFLGSGSSEAPTTIASAAEVDSLRANNSNGDLGFDWGIDPASPSRVHDAQAAMTHRPPAPDHDCIADTILDGRTVYHLYKDGSWQTVQTKSY